ncbi:hypothetical protein QVM41_31405 [Pseudomonas shirazica]
MNRYLARGLLALAALSLLALVWWGWHKGGMALMQLGMSVCWALPCKFEDCLAGEKSHACTLVDGAGAGPACQRIELGC